MVDCVYLMNIYMCGAFMCMIQCVCAHMYQVWKTVVVLVCTCMCVLAWLCVCVSVHVCVHGASKQLKKGNSNTALAFITFAYLFSHRMFNQLFYFKLKFSCS